MSSLPEPKSAQARVPEQCPWRAPIGNDDSCMATCGLLATLLNVKDDSATRIGRDACVACCRSFPPTFETANPVIASLLFDRLQLLGTAVVGASRWRSLRQWAEHHLEIEAPPLDLIEELPGEAAGECFASSLDEALPPPARCGARVAHWAVGVTTAPRRMSRTDECLESLAQAGWPRPHLFIDGSAAMSPKWSSMPATIRGEQLGAWPNFYLALIELLMRDPLADAFLMVQDDSLFYSQENVRAYLERILWPGETPGIVSLYCAASDSTETRGWFRHRERWADSALAVVFPREIACEFATSANVFAHRWLPGEEGLTGVPDVIGAWAAASGTPVYASSPSIVQHIGETSAIWPGAYSLTANRRSDHFIGDSIERYRRHVNFPEHAFPCVPEYQSRYQQLVELGRQRMAGADAVICGLCRDVAAYLPATIARIERLRGMFRNSRVVVYESDSADASPNLLLEWAGRSQGVIIISERLGQPRLTGVNRRRTALMAEYRNRCQQRVVSQYRDYDVVVVMDFDLAGGWSYDGIANSFGQDGWDVIGSNGISFASIDEVASYEYVDAFAYRAHGQQSVAGAAHQLQFHRGEPLVPVWSCFGGLALYQMDSFAAATYTGEDCEHVTFHKALRVQGSDRIFLNPSQIVLYSH